MNIWFKRSLLVIVGGAAGFAYYHFIGCASGTCPITSSPYISTVYGALVGGVIGMGSGTKKQTGQNQQG
ncbi:MAG TPA: hypothetical protein DGH68_07180 [Bacteroidetes bacterium]|jgi:hypothetical protein|nr:hypothetical protein [Bacteroidota bacterium]